MIGVKQLMGQEIEKPGWNSLGFNVFRSKDAEFNKQMNMVFYKYKNNNSVKFNEIRDVSEVPEVLKQKQMLIVSHVDANTVLPRLATLDNRVDKVFKVLFNTSPKMIKSNPAFDLNANKLSVIQSEVDNYLSKL